jgi:bis(5'-nucleosyl)-tetraphosphatase (symmetrical)
MWAIGDLQGCLDPLVALLARLPRDARLVFIGDLVNRGPQSLACLRFVRDLVAQGRAVALLGNHDLHLLAVAHGIRQMHDDDTLQEILDAPDRDELLDWLRQLPLAYHEAGALFVHAGVLPAWTVTQTLALATEVPEHLRGPDLHGFLSTMYGNEPARWDDTLRGPDRWRCVINALTRLRFVRADGSMDLKRKDGPATTAEADDDMPWFDHPARVTRDTPVLFGHWSSLGWMERDDAICLDSGCVWGGCLSALRWPDRARLQQPCPQARVPG